MVVSKTVDMASFACCNAQAELTEVKALISRLRCALATIAAPLPGEDDARMHPRSFAAQVLSREFP